MKRLTLTVFLTLALLFMATPNLYAASGTYIDCIHGCPDLIICSNCCNQVFGGILASCNANRDQCEALCPPGMTDCLDACVMARNNCLMQDTRYFDCPHWGTGVRIMGLGSGPGLSGTGSECKFCHEDDR